MQSIDLLIHRPHTSLKQYVTDTSGGYLNYYYLYRDYMASSDSTGVVIDLLPLDQPSGGAGREGYRERMQNILFLF